MTAWVSVARWIVTDQVFDFPWLGRYPWVSVPHISIPELPIPMPRRFPRWLPDISSWQQLPQIPVFPPFTAWLSWRVHISIIPPPIISMNHPLISRRISPIIPPPPRRSRYMSQTITRRVNPPAFPTFAAPAHRPIELLLNLRIRATRWPACLTAGLEGEGEFIA